MIKTRKKRIPAPKPKVLDKRFVLFMFAVLSVVSGSAYVGHAKLSRSSVPAPIQITDIDLLADHVATLVRVEPGEKPAIAAITDVKVLQAKNPDLYRDAKTGDKLLLWSNQLVIYSPSLDRVILAVPINTPLSAPPEL